MGLLTKKVKDHTQYASEKEMKERLMFSVNWWVAEFSRWSVTRKEFYTAMHEMSEVPFNIHKKTGWRGDNVAQGCTCSDKNKKEEPCG